MVFNPDNIAKNSLYCLFNIDGNTLDSVLSNSISQLEQKDNFPKDALEELQKTINKANVVDYVDQGIAVIEHTCDIEQSIDIIIRTSEKINAVAGQDKIATRFIWVLFSKAKTHEHSAQALQFSNLLKDQEVRNKFYSINTEKEFIDLFKTSVKAQVNLEHHIPEELRPTGKFAGGLMNDVKRTLSTYKKDFTDGFNSKSFASILFLYFACLAPAIAFGGLLEVQTDGAIGVTEMIVATAICGVAYALFSGQPLTILGSTGPVIIFMGILYPICIQYNVPYLPTLACIGLWTMLFLIILALFDACSWIRFFTRFTDDTFAGLISLIFIYEAFSKLLNGFSADDTGFVAYDKAFFALILGLGTYYIATMLSSVRSGVYLRRKVREFLADFGTTIAIILMLVLSLQFKDISISRLEVPDSLEPSSFVITEEKLKEKGISDALSSTIINNPSVLQNTNSSVASKNLSEPIKKELETIGSEESKKLLKSNTKRSWFVNPFDAPSWVIWSSIIPALLLSILLYLDQNITVRLVNHSQYKLQKGSGYHLDLFVVAILVGVCSLLGLPWMVAATVRSLNHVRSLIKVDENAQEEVITGTVETRMTGLFVHILVGISLLLLTFLQLIPMAVLFGLFLYMGFASMKGNQLFERIKLWFMDPSKYPSNYYLKVIPTKEIHKYTFIQSLSLGVLWIVKTSAIAILFPLFIAFLVPIRMALNKFFTHSHLALLDAEETPEDEEYREND